MNKGISNRVVCQVVPEIFLIHVLAYLKLRGQRLAKS